MYIGGMRDENLIVVIIVSLLFAVVIGFFIFFANSGVKDCYESGVCPIDRTSTTDTGMNEAEVWFLLHTGAMGMR